MDVSQRFRLADGAIDQLRWISIRRAEGAGPDVGEAWRRIGALAELWQASPALIKELWLEIDADGPPFPSVFIYYANAVSEDPLVRDSLEVLFGGPHPAWEEARSALKRAAKLDLDVGRTLGVMLSRGGGLRITLRNPGARGSKRFCDDVGWQGSIDQVVSILGSAQIAARQHHLALDYGPALLPTAGLEILPEHEVTDAQWMRPILDWMVEQGFADAERADAIVSWTGALGPSQARTPWPDALIARSLMEDGPPLAWRRISNHLKLNLAPGRSPLAKAYLALLEGAMQ